MTLPKKDSRKITVDDEVYRWYLRGNDLFSGLRHIAIQHATYSGQILLLDPFSWWFNIRPKLIRAAILFGLDHDWKPKSSGGPLFIGYDQGGFCVLPSGKQYLGPSHLSFFVTSQSPKGNMHDYLQSTAIIDWQHPDVLTLAQSLTAAPPLLTAQCCFEWVRDEIKHSHDYQLSPVTCRASDVLAAGTGYCYAKSHLLAALLRANHIPAGLCYQRLHVEADQFCLHGLNALYLPEFGWYRVDARGNKPTVNAQFVPPIEQLAFAIEVPGEFTLPDIYAEPLPIVTAALNAYHTWDALAANLPDISPQSAE